MAEIIFITKFTEVCKLLIALFSFWLYSSFSRMCSLRLVQGHEQIRMWNGDNRPWQGKREDKWAHSMDQIADSWRVEVEEVGMRGPRKRWRVREKRLWKEERKENKLGKRSIRSKSVISKAKKQWRIESNAGKSLRAMTPHTWHLPETYILYHKTDVATLWQTEYLANQTSMHFISSKMIFG